MVDIGYFAFCEAETESAANALARAVEADPSMDSESAGAWLARNYPQIAGNCACEITPLGRRIQDVGYKVYDQESSSFKERPSHVACDRYKIALRYTGTWLSPEVAAASAITQSGKNYLLQAEAVASIDATVEEW